MAPPGQQRQAATRVCLGLGLGQDAPAGRRPRCRRPVRSTSGAATAAALARARRSACCRGSSSRNGVSSMSGAITRSGTMPICARSASRRGLAEARTSARRGHLKRKVIRPLLKIVGRHLDVHPVAGQHADAVLPHLAGGVRENAVLVVELDAEHGVGQQLHHRPAEFDHVLFRHPASCKMLISRRNMSVGPGKVKRAPATAARCCGRARPVPRPRPARPPPGRRGRARRRPPRPRWCA